MKNLMSRLLNTTVSSKRPVDDALRLGLILSERLELVELREWLDRELDGYSVPTEVPSYRVRETHVSGTFAGALGKEISNVRIPHANLAAQLGALHAKNLHRLQFRDSVAECRYMSTVGDSMRSPLSGNTIVKIGTGVFPQMNCFDAYQSIPAGAYAGIIDAVRNRFLRFILELKRTHSVEIADDNWAAVRRGDIVQIFNNSIMRDIAAGDHIIQQEFSK